MPDFQFSDVASKVQAPQVKLNDMLSMATNAMQYQKMQELYPAIIEKEKAASRLTNIQADTAQLDNTMRHMTNVIQSQQRLLTKPDLTADDIAQSVAEHAKNAGTPDSAIKQALQGLPKNGTPTELKSWLAQGLAKTLSTQAQLEKLYPTPQIVNTGQQQVPVAMANPYLSGVPAGTPMGQGIQSQLPPTTPVITETGAPGYLGPQGGSTQPQQGGAGAGQQKPIQSGFAPGQEESIKTGQASYNKALSYSKDIIPRSENINKKIITLLDDPDVDTGPVTKALSGQFKDITLNSKQQELKKYLEQRIQNANAKSVADMESKKDAFGDIKLDKKALKEIIMLDNANLTADSLYAEGASKAIGDPSKPDFRNMNAYDQKWAKAAKDVNVFRYLNAYDEQTKKPKNLEEFAKVQKMLNDMSPEQRKEFAERKNAVLKLVNQGQ